MTNALDARYGRRRSFRSQMLRAAPLILVITALTFVADKAGHLFDSLQFFALDLFSAFSAAESRDVIIVAIGDDDYRDLFHSRSPLNPAEFERILAAVLRHRPAVVGVDVSTADEDDSSLLEHFAKSPVPIVWVRDAFTTGSTASRTSTWQLDRVLGADTPPENLSVGLSLFPRDADRIVRGYYRYVPLNTATGEVRAASLAWSIVELYCRPGIGPERGSSGDDRSECAAVARRAKETPAAGEDDALRFNFAGDRYSFRHVPASAVNQVPEGLLENAIVLIGGTFSAGRDFYVTPLGQLAGVELTALAVESELHSGGITAVSEGIQLALDLAAAVLLVWINWRYGAGSRLGAFLTSTAIIALALLISYAAFRGAGYWANFVPIGVAVWLHAAYDRAREADAIRQELEECRKRHAKT